MQATDPFFGPPLRRTRTLTHSSSFSFIFYSQTDRTVSMGLLTRRPSLWKASNGEGGRKTPAASSTSAGRLPSK